MDGIIERGPNLNVLDATAPLSSNPLYNSWTLPIPPEWYSANRRAFTLVDLDALYGSLLYSRNYGRTASDTVDTPTDVATLAAFWITRGFIDVVAEPSETNTSARTFIRIGDESVTAIIEDTHLIRTQGALVSPIVDIYP